MDKFASDHVIARKQQPNSYKQEKRMATQTRQENLWAIVLAGGQGTRLSTITRALVRLWNA